MFPPVLAAVHQPDQLGGRKEVCCSALWCSYVQYVCAYCHSISMKNRCPDFDKAEDKRWQFISHVYMCHKSYMRMFIVQKRCRADF